jgi:peptidoglycan/LPS O-acetylase OafA/YrhL
VAYRREIDGLRALAVIPVMLFHAGFAFAGGGFVGVDVFFVISGYLITGIILADMERGRFSLAEFYERRARRILPALFLIMAVCVPMALVILIPIDAKDFSQSLAAVAVFASNILFWSEANYFATENELKPLLHTWSLAVEEQYYVIFPLILIVAWRLRRRGVAAMIASIALLSLAFAQWAATHAPVTSFFLLPARAWELMIGALGAFYHAYRAPEARVFAASPQWRQALSAAGIALILYAVFAYDASVPFSSVYALAPTVGALLIILFATPETLAGRTLSSRMAVGIGLISYSAYLWHQPLYAFARHASPTEPAMTTFLVLIGAALALAYFSWRFVELPFRDRANFTRKQIFAWSGIAALVFTAIGAAGSLTQGFASQSERLAMSDIAKFNPRQADCFDYDIDTGLPVGKCGPDGQFARWVLLWGDSHADAFAPELREALADRRIGMSEFTRSACAPVPGFSRDGTETACARHNAAVLSYLRDSVEDTVVLASRWALNLEGTRFDNGEGGVEHGGSAAITPVGEPALSEEERRRRLLGAYVEGVKELLRLNKHVVLVYPIPEMGWNVPRYVLKSSRATGRDFARLPAAGSISHQVFRERNAAVVAAFDAIGDAPGLTRVRMEDIACGRVVPGRCVAHLDGRLLYHDDDHLSRHGAGLLAEMIAAAIARIRESGQ